MFQTIEQASNYIQKAHNLSSSEALTYLQDRYKNVPIDVMLNDVYMEKRSYYLNLHTKQNEHNIWHNDKDDRWKTYIYYKDGSRKMISRKNRRDLEDAVISFYDGALQKITIESIFEEYCYYRQGRVKQTTIVCEMNLYKAFLKDNDFSKKEIKSIRVSDLEVFLSQILYKNHLSKKRFSSLKSLLNGIFDYAVSCDYLQRNVARDAHPIGRTFFDDKGRFDPIEARYEFNDSTVDDEDDIYNLDEDFSDEEYDLDHYFPSADENALILECLRLYQHSRNTAYLGIILNFTLGLRIGELVALKTADFNLETGKVHVRRQEVEVFKERKKSGYRISKKMKTANSNRFIEISPFCRYVFGLIMEDSKSRGLESEFLFLATKSGERMHAGSITKALTIANREAGLPQRSLHKIRKTVLSRLNQSGLFTLEQIRAVAGHSRQSVVLYTNYFYTIKDIEGIRDCKNYSEVVDFKIPDLARFLADYYEE